MLNRLLLLLLLIGIFTEASASPEKKVFSQEPSDLFVDSILETLSIRQKAAQMVLVYHSPVFFMLENQFGGTLVMSPSLRNPRALKAGIDSMQAALPVPLIISLDQEGGKVNRLSRFKEWRHQPSAQELSQWPLDSIRFYAQRIAHKLTSLGINTNLAPVLDPGLDAENQPTFMANAQRAFGNRAEEIVPPARAFAQGLRDEGILAVAKHYPGYDSRTNSDHEIALSQADSLDLQRYREPFRQLAPYLQSVMLSSVQFSRCSQSPAVFDSQFIAMARQDMPDAIIMTDDLWGAALRAWISGKENVDKFYSDADFRKLVLTAVRAGNDMLMITYPIKAVEMVDLLEEEAQKDSALRARIEESCRRIIMGKWKAGLFKNR